jgi:16S rRNA (cytidine1402-2'-O)-methyltransferase
MDHYEIHTPLSSYHEHNEAKETPRLVARLLAGDSVALVSDAGTPLVSDPGSRLVNAAIEAKVPVVPIPGPSSVLAALVGSGLSLERFTFFGFLPRKGKERTETLTELVASHATSVLFEAGNRVGATLAALAAAGAGERNVVVARELTKQFEEFRRGSVAELASVYKETDPKGEVVLVLAGARKSSITEEELGIASDQLRREGKQPRDVVEHLISLGASRNIAYKLAHERAS